MTKSKEIYLKFLGIIRVKREESRHMEHDLLVFVDIVGLLLVGLGLLLMFLVLLVVI